MLSAQLNALHRIGIEHIWMKGQNYKGSFI